MSPAGVVKVDQIRYSNFGGLKASGSSTLPLGGANLPRAPFEVPTGGWGGVWSEIQWGRVRGGCK